LGGVSLLLVILLIILLSDCLLLLGNSIEEKLEPRWVSGRGSGKCDRSWRDLTPVQNWTKLKNGTSNYIGAVKC
jgi:hypothetical protein